MAQLDVEDEVKTDLDAFTAIQPIEVYHFADMPLDEQLPTEGGLVTPHVIIHPGSPVSSGVGRGIIGPQKDPLENYFMVEVVGPNRDIVREIGALIDDRYLGLRFTGTSQLRLGRASSWSSAAGEAGSQTPRSYHRAVMYRYMVNL